MTHEKTDPDSRQPRGLAQIPGIMVEEPETDFWSRLMLELLSVLVPEDLL